MTRATAVSALLALMLSIGAARPCAAQASPPPDPQDGDTSTPAPADPGNPPPTQRADDTQSQQQGLDDTISAAETDPPRRRLVKFNEYEGPLGSIRVGFGFLWDYASFTQDENSKQQVDMESQWKYRDGRLLLSGKLKFKRPTTWSAGIMYDGSKQQWVFRQTGIMVAVPEVWGSIFVGRTKEGFSLNKVMIGYGGWTIERAPVSDAMLPILADGVKWLGYVPKAHILWNLGWYGDSLSEGQSFSTYKNQVSGRFVWAPLLSTDGGNLLHFGISERWGKPKDDELQLKARPGAWAAPYVVDTSDFPTDRTWMTGLEAYFRPHQFTFGTEYFFLNTHAPSVGNPMFHGGEVFATWLITGEVRTYNTKGGYFNQISPKRPVFSGGPGAWEVVADYTYTDFNDKSIAGGKYWRFTPMVNWYVSDNLRLEFVYGYGSLDRFNLLGRTHFFQTRIQLQL